VKRKFVISHLPQASSHANWEQLFLMTLTLNINDELAAFLPQGDAAIAAVFEAGLRKKTIQAHWQVEEMSELTELLANLPTPVEVLNIRPSPKLTARVETLLQRTKSIGLSSSEKAEWLEILQMEHTMRLAKSRAAQLVSQAKSKSE
jgi:hypothetical protein